VSDLFEEVLSIRGVRLGLESLLEDFERIEVEFSNEIPPSDMPSSEANLPKDSLVVYEPGLVDVVVPLHQTLIRGEIFLVDLEPLRELPLAQKIPELLPDPVGEVLDMLVRDLRSDRGTAWSAVDR